MRTRFIEAKATSPLLVARVLSLIVRPEARHHAGALHPGYPLNQALCQTRIRLVGNAHGRISLITGTNFKERKGLGVDFPLYLWLSCNKPSQPSPRSSKA